MGEDVKNTYEQATTGLLATGRVRRASWGAGTSGTEPPDMSDNEDMPSMEELPYMEARLSKLEIALDGMRHAQNLTLAGVAGVGAAVLAVGGIIVALMIYGFTRTDQLSDRLAGLPGQIAAENRDIIKTLSDAITATKQQAPQVILLPAPQPSPTVAPPTP